MSRDQYRLSCGSGTTSSALPRNVLVLGIVSLLMGMSSAMIYGVLPIFLVTALGASMASVGAIEGLAEATTSFMKIISGYASDRLGRRKPLVVLGYVISAVNKLVFPLAASVGIVLVARMADRVGKGIRDAPRDALQTDITPSDVRGAGFGLRLALYTTGALIGPLAAIGIMKLSGDDFRLVFWIALIPGFASVPVLFFGVREPVNAPANCDLLRRAIAFRDWKQLPAPFWWAILLTAVLALARFSPAFLVLKAHETGVDAALVPAVLALMYLVYSISAYPFGLLVDRTDRYVQLSLGIAVLIGADLVLAFADALWIAALGAALWGLQMGITQGLLSTMIGDSAPQSLRGTAFGMFDFAVGVATFLASAAAGLLWTVGGSALTFGSSALIAVLALVILILRPAIVARAN